MGESGSKGQVRPVGQGRPTQQAGHKAGRKMERGLTRQLFLRPEALQAIVPGEDEAAASEGLCEDHMGLPLVGERFHAQCRFPNRLEPRQLWG